MNETTRQAWTADSILKHLAQHRDALRRLGVTKMGLFGSYARGEQTPESDLDFLIVFEPNDYFVWMRIWDYLEETFGMEVDAIPERALRPEFQPYVEKDILYVDL